MKPNMIAGTPAPTPPDLTDLDMPAIRGNISPAVLEMIGQQFLDFAARLRANGFTGGEGRA